jgi:hypothetical protein
MKFPPKWEILTYAVSRAIGVCNDTIKSEDDALDALRIADATFEAIMFWDEGKNFSSGTVEERISFIKMRSEIHLMMIKRGVTSNYSH